MAHARKKKQSSSISIELATDAQEAWGRMLDVVDAYCRTFCIDESRKNFFADWEKLQFQLHLAFADLPFESDEECAACSFVKSVPFLPSYLMQCDSQYRGPLFMPEFYPVADEVHADGDSEEDVQFTHGANYVGRTFVFRSDYFTRTAADGYPLPPDEYCKYVPENMVISEDAVGTDDPVMPDDILEDEASIGGDELLVSVKIPVEEKWKYDFVDKNVQVEDGISRCEFSTAATCIMCSPKNCLDALVRNRGFELSLLPMNNEFRIPGLLEAFYFSQDLARRIFRWSLVDSGGEAPYSFKAEGKNCRIVFNGKEHLLSNVVGFKYLRILIKNADKRFDAMELHRLVQVAEQSNASPGIAASEQRVFAQNQEASDAAMMSNVSEKYVFKKMDSTSDDKAMKEYREQLVFVQEELATARQNNDIGQIEHLQGVESELIKQIGDASFQRKRKGNSGKVDKTVPRAIRRALEGIEPDKPSELRDYFMSSITTGASCVYRSHPEIDWEF